MLQASPVPSKFIAQRDARSLHFELIPEKFDRSRFDLYFERMWLGAVALSDCGEWGCVTSEIPSEKSLEILAIKMLDAYLDMASVSSPGFKERILAA